MKWWRWILLLVVVAALAALGWHWMAADPGYVLVRLRGWEVETTVWVAVVIILLAVLVLMGLAYLVRWPLGAAGRHRRRVCRQQLLNGLLALAEGRFGAAERALTRAAHLHAQKGAALLAASRAASRRGDLSVAGELLDQAATEVPQAARIARARLLRRQGKAQAAMNLLAPEADSGKLPPAGWIQLVKAALAVDDTARAQQALAPLRKTGALDDEAQAALEARVLVAALRATPDGAHLKSLWSDLSKAQRRRTEVVAAYARQAAHFGQSMAAMGELEAALNRQWSAPLVEAWGQLDGGELDVRLRRAEGWLVAHADDAALLSTLGQLSARLNVWGKAREYLARALAVAPSAAAWEALGDVHAGQGNVLLSQRCYRNALRMARGEVAEDLPGLATETAQTAIGDQRDEHGVPHLPKAAS